MVPFLTTRYDFSIAVGYLTKKRCKSQKIIVMASSKVALWFFITFSNEKRRHQNFDKKTPTMVYCVTLPQKQVAA